MDILLIEDNPRDIFLLEELLANTISVDYQLTKANELTEALDIIKDKNYDLILLDLGLPDSDGTDAVTKIKTIKEQIPIVVLTGNTNEDLGLEALKKGAQDYLIKGFNSSTSLNRVFRYAIERQAIKEKIKESEAFFKSTLNSLSVFIIIIDQNGNIINSNTAWENSVLYSTETKENHQNFNTLIQNSTKIDQTAADSITNGINLVLNGKKDFFDSEFYIHLEKTYWFYLKATPLTDAKTSQAVITIEDITRKKRHEIFLQTSHDNYKKILNNIDTGIIIIDADKNIIEVNQRAKDWFPEILLNKSDYKEFLTLMEKTEKLPTKTAFNEGKIQSYEIEYKEKFFQLLLSPLPNPLNNEVFNLIFIQDITLQKHEEQEQQQSKKMEAIGLLAGGIAHDFNNILTSIIGNTEIALSESDQDPDMKDHLEEIYSSSSRASDLVKQILTFCRQSTIKLIPVDIAPIIYDSLKLIKSSIPSTVSVESNIEENIEPVMANETQIHQILLNLCTNAYHAMLDKPGELTINFRNAYPNELKELKDIQPNTNYVLLEVVDNGHGMPNEMVDSIFMPYFTTKPKEQGTGLGLSVVHGIVKNYNGIIKVFSIPEKGTSVKIFLPLSTQSKKEKSENNHVQAQQARGKEKILIVDDEMSILKMTSKLLEKSGYSVSATTDPTTVVAMIEQDPNLCDLIITDMTMPVLTGYELAHKILQINKEMPIIIWTGYSHLISKEKTKALGVKALIRKPFSNKKLLKEIRDVLSNNARL